MSSRRSSSSGLLAVHLVAAVAVLLGATVGPPARGRILLVPLSSNAASGMIGRAIATGARLVGQGPIAGSIVVEGSRSDLAAALGAPRVLMLAAPAAGCA